MSKAPGVGYDPTTYRLLFGIRGMTSMRPFKRFPQQPIALPVEATPELLTLSLFLPSPL
jgi:hypothetical protein